LRKTTFHYIEDILRDYPQTESYIRDELKKEDMTIIRDRSLRLLREHENVVEWTLKESDNDTKSIIEELYFKHNPVLTITGVALQLHVSRTVASRKRKRFFEQVAKRLGIR